MCAYGAGTAVEEPGVLPELVLPDSFPDVWLLFCEMGGGGGGGVSRQNVADSDLVPFYHVEFVVSCSVRNTDWVSVNF